MSSHQKNTQDTVLITQQDEFLKWIKKPENLTKLEYVDITSTEEEEIEQACKEVL